MVQTASGPDVTARSATVSERYRPSRHGGSVVPMIRLAGQWLSDAGFNVGDRLIIKVSRHELYITARPRKAATNQHLVSMARRHQKNFLLGSSRTQSNRSISVR